MNVRLYVIYIQNTASWRWVIIILTRTAAVTRVAGTIVVALREHAFAASHRLTQGTHWLSAVHAVAAARGPVSGVQPVTSDHVESVDDDATCAKTKGSRLQTKAQLTRTKTLTRGGGFRATCAAVSAAEPLSKRPRGRPGQPHRHDPPADGDGGDGRR
jgi:hypothetical protein